MNVLRGLWLWWKTKAIFLTGMAVSLFFNGVALGRTGGSTDTLSVGEMDIQTESETEPLVDALLTIMVGVANVGIEVGNLLEFVPQPIVASGSILASMVFLIGTPLLYVKMVMSKR